MKFKKKEPKRIEDLTPEEAENLRRFHTKQAKEVKTKDTLLYGEEAMKQKPRGRVIKGGINWRLNPKDPLILNK